MMKHLMLLVAIVMVVLQISSAFPNPDAQSKTNFENDIATLETLNPETQPELENNSEQNRNSRQIGVSIGGFGVGVGVGVPGKYRFFFCYSCYFLVGLFFL